jgi:hypothetical protein
VTVAEAIRDVQRVGAVQASAASLRIKFPASMCVALQPAIDALRDGKAEALKLLTASIKDTIPWADWKAAELNRLFQEQGTSGQRGRITAATVLHGARGRKTNLGVD